MTSINTLFLLFQTGGADSASGGSGGSGMECLQLRTPPEPFHYLISEQAKSLVALQELQNEVGALLEFRDLVIETFPNLRSKMPPSTPASNARRDWEPGDAHSSASASAGAPRPRPAEDELVALLDVIQRKGARLRDEADQLRGEIDANTTAEESFARAMQDCDCGELQRLRSERDALLARAAELEASACLSPALPTPPRRPLGRLDSVLDTPARPPRVPTPCSSKFAAILTESNPVELQRQLLTSTVQNQLCIVTAFWCIDIVTSIILDPIFIFSILKILLNQTHLTTWLSNFQLEEKSIELEGTRALVRKLEKNRSSESIERSDAHSRDAHSRDAHSRDAHSRDAHSRDAHSRDVHSRDAHSRDAHSRDAYSRDAHSRDAHSSMRDMEPLHIPDEEATISETPKRRPSRIPQPHTANKGAAPRPPAAPAPPSRPPSAHSVRSARSASSGRHHGKSSVP
ncbi:Javelin-like [Operophtera brumata]|uniref:Javelin-like n=1 Tax=Operophtera brumata TaxID=104452 RepID=A0A0L7LVL8_OPEBR|nr:Javelin-like [Operophtera brumata]